MNIIISVDSGSDYDYDYELNNSLSWSSCSSHLHFSQVHTLLPGEELPLHSVKEKEWISSISMASLATTDHTLVLNFVLIHK